MIDGRTIMNPISGVAGFLPCKFDQLKLLATLPLRISWLDRTLGRIFGLMEYICIKHQEDHLQG